METIFETKMTVYWNVTTFRRVCMYVCMHVRTYVRVCVYMYIYIHTHTECWVAWRWKQQIYREAYLDLPDKSASSISRLHSILSQTTVIFSHRRQNLNFHNLRTEIYSILTWLVFQKDYIICRMALHSEEDHKVSETGYSTVGDGKASTHWQLVKRERAVQAHVQCQTP
jgi:hypothetical protein